MEIPVTIPDLGFHFSQEQEELILDAIDDAIEFMKNYGAGRQPQTIDKRYYINPFAPLTAKEEKLVHTRRRRTTRL